MITTATLVVLGAATALFFVRLLLGPTLVDRVVGMDGMLTCGIATIVVRAVDSGDGAFLPVAVVVTLVGFIGTSVIARFVERQGG